MPSLICSFLSIFPVYFTLVTVSNINPVTTVLMGLELESGQMVEQTVEKKFSGDLRLGLTVLGKHRAEYHQRD